MVKNVIYFQIGQFSSHWAMLTPEFGFRESSHELGMNNLTKLGFKEHRYVFCVFNENQELEREKQFLNKKYMQRE